MASPQVLDRLFVYSNGAPLAWSDQVTVSFQGSPVVAVTFFMEFAGVTPTPKSCKIDVESFVPRTGTGLEVVRQFLKTELVKPRMQFGGSGLILNLEGFVDVPSIRSSATDATKLSFSYMCNAAAFA